MTVVYGGTPRGIPLAFEEQLHHPEPIITADVIAVSRLQARHMQQGAHWRLWRPSAQVGWALYLEVWIEAMGEQQAHEISLSSGGGHMRLTAQQLI